MASAQPHWQILKAVCLGPQHHPSLTRHLIHDQEGIRALAAFVSLEIARERGTEAGSGGCYLLRIAADDTIADTWHVCLEDALAQAEWEFGVAADEWV